MWLRKNKWKLILPILALALLTAAFYFGGSAPGARGWSVTEPAPSVAVTAPVSTAPTQSAAPHAEITPEPSAQAASSTAADKTPQPTPETAAEATTAPHPETTSEAAAEAAPSAAPSVEISTEAAPPSHAVEETSEPSQNISGAAPASIPPETPQASAPPVTAGAETAAIGEYSCQLSISCGTLIGSADLLSPEKAELVPVDGWVLPATDVVFYEGESVFNVLQRTCRQLLLHMEYSSTPLYDSAYIEGIQNIYEFDAGELSGWMYSVNGVFPNFSCSDYLLCDGDVVCWAYTCDHGADIGSDSAAQNGQRGE